MRARHVSHMSVHMPVTGTYPCICRSWGSTRAYAGHEDVPVHMPVMGTYPFICWSRVPIQSSELITIHLIHNNAKMTTPVITFYVRQPFQKSTGNSGLKNAIQPTFTSIWSCGTSVNNQTALGMGIYLISVALTIIYYVPGQYLQRE